MNHVPPTLDMRPDGSFRTPSRSGAPLSFKLLMAALAVAVVAGAVAVAALALWVLSMVLPVLVVAGAATYALYRYRRWQALRGGGRHLRPL